MLSPGPTHPQHGSQWDLGGLAPHTNHLSKQITIIPALLAISGSGTWPRLLHIKHFSSIRECFQNEYVTQYRPERNMEKSAGGFLEFISSKSKSLSMSRAAVDPARLWTSHYYQPEEDETKTQREAKPSGSQGNGTEATGQANVNALHFQLHAPIHCLIVGASLSWVPGTYSPKHPSL